MQGQLNLIIEKHCVSIKQTVSSLGKMLGAIQRQATANQQTAITDAEALAHQLKGGSGTLGFREISQAATMLDDNLKALCKENQQDILDGIGQAIELFSALDRAAREATPRCSTLYHADSTTTVNSHPSSARQ
jgi:HPt (histidine-containing phosphotransfer) domain-containing protein